MAMMADHEQQDAREQDQVIAVGLWHGARPRRRLVWLLPMSLLASSAQNRQSTGRDRSRPSAL